ncbi:MAG: hypothetical protein AABX29_07895 [Nanoarchaeota archaeon]
MQQENKILLSAILVLGVAMLSSSFLNLTGNLVNCKESIAVASPKEIDGGDVVTIAVSNGEGVYEEAKVFMRSFDRNGIARDSKISYTTRDVCDGEYKCKEAMFKIQTFPAEGSNIWVDNQDYVVKLKDVCTGDFTIEAPFRIR